MNPLTGLKQRLNRLGDDERAVSPVIGFVLIFALIMIVFTLYQTNVVPAQNSEVEFHQSQTVQKQMSLLNDQIIQTAATGRPQSVTLDTGVQYPSRAIAINPGNPVGTLKTVSAGQNVTISGVGAVAGSSTTCEFSDVSFLNYHPNYNRLNEETTSSIEYGMVVQDYESGATRLASEGVAFPDQADNPIRLTLIEGDIQSSQMTTSVSTELLHNYTTIKSKSGGTISLPTTLSKAGWTSLLSGKANLDLSSYTERSGASNTANIAIDPEKNGRTIQVKRVTPGGADSTTKDGCGKKRYIVNETTLSPNVSLSSEESVAVSVEDQFGNPITKNVTVEASTTGSGSLTPTSTHLNASGQAGFTYDPVEADSGSTVDVDVTLANGSANQPRTFELKYPELTIDNETALSPNVTLGSSVNLTVSTGDSTGRTLSDIDIAASHTGGGTLTPTNMESGEDGEATFTYTPNDTDSGSTVQVTASLPNGSDSVTFDLEYPTGSTGGNREPLNANLKLPQKGVQTDLVFKITPSPVDIRGFSVVTKNDAENLTETQYTHSFEITRTQYISGRPNSANGLRYESSEPIQFDGQDYIFEEGPRRVNSARVLLQEWDDTPDFEVTINGLANSYESADIVVYFITKNGKRPVYVDATMNTNSN